MILFRFSDIISAFIFAPRFRADFFIDALMLLYATMIYRRTLSMPFFTDDYFL